MGPRHWVMSIYSVVKDPKPGQRQDRCTRVRPQAPTYIIPDEKKRGRGLIIVFMEIQPVTGFVGEI